ncbi:MAG: F0F1 ATP synthase subunit B [Candidatus Kerfeldbacteria bacterium]|nr:F0F1 ATP synthase subunit B [Candidatus Kerfeldbacteria bacterium]
MTELLEKFGINFFVLIAQAVNFLIVLAVLYRFAYKPILKMLNDRTKKIEQGLEHAKKAEHAMNEALSQKDAVLAEARKESGKLLAQAEEKSAAEHAKRMAESKTEAQAMIAKTKEELQREHEHMLESAKLELADMVVLATEKLLKEKVTSERDHTLVASILKDVSK